MKVDHEPISAQEIAHRVQVQEWVVGTGVLVVLVGVIVFFVSPGTTGPLCSNSGGFAICSSGGPLTGRVDQGGPPEVS